MSKNIVLKASAAALAASLALLTVVPAFAQPPGYNDPELSGAPPLFKGQQPEGYRDRDGNRNDRDDWRRRKPDFQQMQRDCSREGIQEAWDRNYYSAQYNEAPRLTEGKYGWELRGNMRLHDRKGYRYVDTVCSIDRGNVRFDFR